MTTPDVPLRLEYSIELPGTPEQVWDAIATGRGISAWFMPTDLEEHEGGRMLVHMGPTDSAGRVTGWEPSSRLAYEEPDWAALGGREGADVTPLATEFLIEAKSGGTCVVRVVSSAFGTGADWEQEFFDAMGVGWLPYLEHLRVYLTHFPGQTATPLQVETDVKGTPAAVGDAMAAALGVTPSSKAGDPVDLRGLAGVIERVGEQHVLARATEGVTGYFAFFSYDKGDGMAAANITGYLFSGGAAAYVDREQPAWQSWVENLAVPS